MIPIKIQCGCGQRYSFEIEPVQGRMPNIVACPVCGADGTAAANVIIAQSTPAAIPRAIAVAPVAVAVAAPALAATAASSGGTGLRFSAPVAPSAPAPGRGGGLLPGQIDRNQATIEARAKIMWGDAAEDVVKFLMIQGISHSDATEMVEEMFAERAATVRQTGIRKIFVGSGLVTVPIIAAIIFLMIGFFPIKLFGFTVLVGIYGAWMVFKGILMTIAPRSEPGEVGSH
jgi:hypothetical protein